MTKLLLFFFIFTSSYCFSQEEQLFYFVEKDSLIGVKNQKGTIIIQPKKLIFPDYEGINGTEIKDKVLFFMTSFEGVKAYNRKGEFLFVPYIFDAGIDYFREGFIRFTENKKMGLADANGNKVIEAKYDFISSMNFGVVSYCNGCYWDTKKDEEHPPLVGGTWGFMNRKGEEIIPTLVRNHPKDIQKEDNKFIPYQFKYNEEEERILNYFYARKDAISKILNANCIGCDSYQMAFEIVEKPDKESNYYKVKLYEILDGKAVMGSDDEEEYKNFTVTADGNHFYVHYSN